jgi:hypothetical protein
MYALSHATVVWRSLAAAVVSSTSANIPKRGLISSLQLPPISACGYHRLAPCMELSAHTSDMSDTVPNIWVPILQHGVPTRGELLPSKPTFVSLDLLRDAASRAYLCCVASCMRDGYMYMDMYSGMMWMPNLGRGRVVCRSLSRLSVSTGGTCSVRPSSTRTVSAGGSG